MLDAVVYAVVMGPNLNYSKHQSLLSRIIAIHVAYWFHHKEIMWLGQLTSVMPGIIVPLKNMDGNTTIIIILIFSTFHNHYRSRV